MLDALDVLFGNGAFRVLDLACGPGSISARVLDRFPRATSVAVDLDPVLIAMGRNALARFGDRLRFIEADLRDSDWTAQLGHEEFAAVISTTALHWLPPAGLVSSYRACFELLKPGGVLINGDNMAFAPAKTTIRRIQYGLQAKQRAAVEGRPGEGFQEWWARVGEDPSLRELYEERQRRFAWRNTADYRPGFEMHRAILLEAGFREVDTILQHGHNRVLVAVK
jgi:SAM-dependent methyltransferase